MKAATNIAALILLEYAYGAGIERLFLSKERFVILWKIVNAKTGVAQRHDANGKFIVNRQSSEDKNTEADYVVHSFERPEPFLNGSVHLLGDLCYNRLDNSSRMHYNFETHYTKIVAVKQGVTIFIYLSLQTSKYFGKPKAAIGKQITSTLSTSIIVRGANVTTVGCCKKHTKLTGKSIVRLFLLSSSFSSSFLSCSLFSLSLLCLFL